MDQLILHSPCLCVCQVNGQNVVKVGHRQVVNMIRQGGNSLMVKVVMVARNPELEDTVRKRGESQTFPRMSFPCPCLWCDDKADCVFTLPLKSLLQCGCHWWLRVYTRILNIKSAFGWLPLAAPQQTKRLTPPAIALRSKSMTSELEDMGKTREGTKDWMQRGGEVKTEFDLSPAQCFFSKGSHLKKLFYVGYQLLCRVIVQYHGTIRETALNINRVDTESQENYPAQVRFSTSLMWKELLINLHFWHHLWRKVIMKQVENWHLSGAITHTNSFLFLLLLNQTCCTQWTKVGESWICVLS